MVSSTFLLLLGESFYLCCNIPGFYFLAINQSTITKGGKQDPDPVQFLLELGALKAGGRMDNVWFHQILLGAETPSFRPG